MVNDITVKVKTSTFYDKKSTIYGKIIYILR